MSDSPLVRIGRLQAAEAAFEVVAPLAAASGAWLYARSVLGEAVPGAPLTWLELAVLLGACVALTAWAVARQLYLLGQRSPRKAVLWAAGAAAVALLALPFVVRRDFEQACATAAGSVVEATAPGSSVGARVCRLGAAPPNTYLPGVILRPAWDGVVTPLHWAGLLAVAAASALGLRTQRLRRTRVPVRLIEDLRFAPAAGSGSVLGDSPPKEARIQACGNATLWGEVCGQLYSADKTFEPGEWCQRCNQIYRPVDREISFQVVSLFSGDVDVLNGLERVDTVSWRQGEPMPPDARISGQERWVRLGKVTFPDTLTVAQALAFIHELLPTWQGATDAAVQKSAGLALARASRIHCWIWQGSVASRLTYARPTTDVWLAIGPVRLRDLPIDRGEELTLQLDIGFLPLELRVGFRKAFLDQARGEEIQNSRQNLWVPVAPPSQPEDAVGVWLPRVEGDALRAWLATEQARSEGLRGVSTPLPYRPEGPPEREFSGVLDLVRMPGDTLERRIGASIAEWRWLEGEQIELLRREPLVLVEAGRSA